MNAFVECQKKRFFCIERERVFVPKRFFFFLVKKTADCTALLLFAFWGFLFDRLGVLSGFSDNATGTSFPVFSSYQRAAGAVRREDARTREDARRGRRFLLCIVLPLCITENWTSLETSAEPCKATFPLSAE
jgi:hypothetical protein